MLDHYIMFRLRPEKKGELEAFVGRLKQLEQDVPEVRFAEVLLNSVQARKSYDVMYHCRFDDESAYRAYISHPKHVPVVQYVDEICEAVASVDVGDHAPKAKRRSEPGA